MVEIGIFAAKTGIIVLGLVLIIVAIAIAAARANQSSELEIEPLHKKYEDIKHFLKSFILSKDELKKEMKELKNERKKEKKAKSNQDSKSIKKLYVLNFKGDIQAHDTVNLREEITALLQTATQQDEVLVKIESPGGVVHGYGLAASQLLRIRNKGIPLTVAVDKVAASGGYLMACVANKIIAAPFAILGSVGVVAQFPNFNKVLKKYDVDYKEYTAGEFKRTVGMLSEITPKGEDKFRQELEDTHILFKNWVQTNRPQVKIDQIATGEHWYGQQAVNLGLIDEIMTSDDYLLQAFQAETPIYEIRYEKKRPIAEKISDLIGATIAQSGSKALQQFENRQLF